MKCENSKLYMKRNKSTQRDISEMKCVIYEKNGKSNNQDQTKT